MNNRKIFILLGIVVLLPASTVSKEKYCKLVIINAQKKRVVLYAEVARTSRQRSRGLMFRKKMKQSHGMLFVFNGESRRNFWMKNTYLPLSIAYINKEGRINEIYAMKPLDTSVTYPSIVPAKYALEVNQGWFKKNNITSSCRILLNGCISK